MFPATLSQQHAKNIFMNWISINESLPEFDKDVLISIEGKNPCVLIGYLQAKNESSGGTNLIWRADSDEFGRFSNPKITHWMPLPEPATKPEQ